MLPFVRLLAVFASVSLLAGCHASGGINAVPAVPLALQENGAMAGAVDLEPIGPTHMSDGFPTSGKVNAFAVSPSNSKVIYAASGRGTGLETYSSAGIVKTVDGGSSWMALTHGLVDKSGNVVSVINSLWIDSTDPSVVLAATEYDGIFRTNDGGASWSNVFSGGQATEFTPFGKQLFATDDAGILASTDSGKTWSVQLRGTPQEHPTAIGRAEGSHGNALYAGMSDGYIYTYARGKWKRTGRLPFTKKTGTAGSTRMVHQIAVDPLKPSTVYVSSNDGMWDQNLFASTDGGKTWVAILKDSYYGYGLGTQAIAYSKAHPHRLYVGEDGGFYYIPGDGSPNPHVTGAASLKIVDLRNIWTEPKGNEDACWIASDQGLDYAPSCASGNYNDRVVTAAAATGLARRFTVSPDGKTLMVSLQDFGSHLTINGGSSWKLAPLYEDGFNELRPGNAKMCYAYDEASGLSISSNGCITFSGSNNTIFPSRIMTTPIAFDPKHPLTMYLTSGPNPGAGFHGPKGIFRSTDGGKTVSQLSWPFAWPGAVVVDQRNGGHLLVGDLKNGKSSLSVTTDGGAKWTKSSGVIPTQFWYALTISPVNGKIALASSVDAKNNVFVLRSTDGGASFKKVSVVTNAPLVRGRSHLESELLRGVRSSRLSEPGQPEGEETQAFVYSPERELRYNGDVSRGTPYVVITTLRGAYLSPDNGSTWRRLDTGLIAHSFWGIRWLNGYLYLASDGQGVVRSSSPLQTVGNPEP
jgi:photosystem II stability/assembly factor-like uncharacterized protein